MTQKLKIKVKEFVEEKRPLNDAERELVDLYYMTTSIKTQDEIKRFWKVQGFDYKSYDGNEGTFRKEIIRDATPDEFDAWYFMRKTNDGSMEASLTHRDIIRGNLILSVMTNHKARDILKDKEIILELEESE